jgi:hypothetical protein
VQPLFRGFRTVSAVNGAEATARAGWETLRDSWWSWHLARLAAGIFAELLLIAGVFADRSS